MKKIAKLIVVGIKITKIIKKIRFLKIYSILVHLFAIIGVYILSTIIFGLIK